MLVRHPFNGGPGGASVGLQAPAGPALAAHRHLASLRFDCSEVLLCSSIFGW